MSEETTKAKDKSEEFRKAYEKLAGEKELPSYDALNKEFDLDIIDDSEKQVLREVAKRMAEKHDTYAHFLEGLLHPESTIASMQESNAFTDAERENMILLLKKIMLTFRTYSLCELDGNDAQFTAFIAATWTNWPDLKAQMRDIVVKVRDAWSKDETVVTDFGYLG